MCDIPPPRTDGIVTTAKEQKPDASEYLPYYGRYIALVPDGDIVLTLEDQMRDSNSILTAIPPAVGSPSQEEHSLVAAA